MALGGKNQLDNVWNYQLNVDHNGQIILHIYAYQHVLQAQIYTEILHQLYVFQSVLIIHTLTINQELVCQDVLVAMVFMIHLATTIHGFVNKLVHSLTHMLILKLLIVTVYFYALNLLYNHSLIRYQKVACHVARQLQAYSQM